MIMIHGRTWPMLYIILALYDSFLWLALTAMIAREDSPRIAP